MPNRTKKRKKKHQPRITVAQATKAIGSAAVERSKAAASDVLMVTMLSAWAKFLALEPGQFLTQEEFDSVMAVQAHLASAGTCDLPYPVVAALGVWKAHVPGNALTETEIAAVRILGAHFNRLTTP